MGVENSGRSGCEAEVGFRPDSHRPGQKSDERIQELIEGLPELVGMMGPLLAARQKLREMFARFVANCFDCPRG